MASIYGCLIHLGIHTMICVTCHYHIHGSDKMCLIMNWRNPVYVKWVCLFHPTGRVLPFVKLWSADHKFCRLFHAVNIRIIRWAALIVANDSCQRWPC